MYFFYSLESVIMSAIKVDRSSEEKQMKKYYQQNKKGKKEYYEKKTMWKKSL